MIRVIAVPGASHRAHLRSAPGAVRRAARTVPDRGLGVALPAPTWPTWGWRSAARSSTARDVGPRDPWSARRPGTPHSVGPTRVAAPGGGRPQSAVCSMLHPRNRRRRPGCRTCSSRARQGIAGDRGRRPGGRSVPRGPGARPRDEIGRWSGLSRSTSRGDPNLRL